MALARDLWAVRVGGSFFFSTQSLRMQNAIWRFFLFSFLLIEDTYYIPWD